MKLLLLTLTNAEGKVPERSDPARRCVGIFKAALCPSTGTASAWRIQPRDPPTLTPAMEKAPRPQTNLLIIFFRGAGNGRHLPGCSGLLEEQGKLSKSVCFQNLSQSSSSGTSPLSPAGGVVVGWPHHPFGCAQHLAMPPKNWDPLGCSAQAPLSLHGGLDAPSSTVSREFFFSQNNAQGGCLHTGGGCERFLLRFLLQMRRNPRGRRAKRGGRRVDTKREMKARGEGGWG